MKRVVVVGVGALGSHLVLLGRNWPVRFTLIDFDRVEQKNLASQLHGRTGVGRNKARALQQLMQGLFGLRVEAVPHRLVDDNVEALLGDADWVLDCVDDAPTRRLIQAFATERGLPCLHGALAADGSYARVMWSEAFGVDDGDAGAPTCEDGEHLPFVAIV
ncbi:MAG: ThiF family adenylyltransferase, partial [Myxococcota bacterium]